MNESPRDIDRVSTCAGRGPARRRDGAWRPVFQARGYRCRATFSAENGRRATSASRQTARARSISAACGPRPAHGGSTRIDVPRGLSFIVWKDPDAEVTRPRRLPAARTWPNVTLLHFRVPDHGRLRRRARGVALAGAALALAAARSRTPVYSAPRARRAARPPPTECGWVVTEVGRQPWIIYNVMRYRDAVTPMPNLVVTLTTSPPLRLHGFGAPPLYHQMGRGPALRPGGPRTRCDVIPPLETMIAGIMGDLADVLRARWPAPTSRRGSGTPRERDAGRGLHCRVYQHVEIPTMATPQTSAIGMLRPGLLLLPPPY